MAAHRILILGGTGDARTLAARLANGGHDVILSLAGRTAEPVAQGVPTISGGFGGAEGLARFVTEQGISLMVDATHPYAARMSRNAAEASARSGVPLVALRRPGWEQADGDRWTLVADPAAAADALGDRPRRVLLTLGRNDIAAFEAAPQHDYLIRSVDRVDPPLDLPRARYLLARGPFAGNDERALLEREHIDVVVSKNSGGAATYGKIAAARALGLPVIMIERPVLPDVPSAATVEALLPMIEHQLILAEKRGV